MAFKHNMSNMMALNVGLDKLAMDATILYGLSVNKDLSLSVFFKTVMRKFGKNVRQKTIMRQKRMMRRFEVSSTMRI